MDNANNKRHEIVHWPYFIDSEIIIRHVFMGQYDAKGNQEEYEYIL